MPQTVPLVIEILDKGYVETQAPLSGPQLLFLPLREGISHLQSSAPTPQVLLLEPNWSSWAFSLSQSTTGLVLPPFLICLLHVPILPA